MFRIARRARRVVAISGPRPRRVRADAFGTCVDAARIEVVAVLRKVHGKPVDARIVRAGVAVIHGEELGFALPREDVANFDRAAVAVLVGTHERKGLAVAGDVVASAFHARVVRLAALGSVDASPVRHRARVDAARVAVRAVLFVVDARLQRDVVSVVDGAFIAVVASRIGGRRRFRDFAGRAPARESKDALTGRSVAVFVFGAWVVIAAVGMRVDAFAGKRFAAVVDRARVAVVAVDGNERATAAFEALIDRARETIRTNRDDVDALLRNDVAAICRTRRRIAAWIWLEGTFAGVVISEVDRAPVCVA